MMERVLPGVWRWSAPDATDVSPIGRCGTALATLDGLMLVDPPALSAEAREQIEREAGPVKHVVLTSARLATLAASYRTAGVTIWAPASPAQSAPVIRHASPAPMGEGQGETQGEVTANGIDHAFGFDDRLPGGLMACQLPEDAAPGGEVALLAPDVAEGLLMTGDVLPVVGQIPVYLEGDAPPMPAFLDAIKALLAAEPGALAPGRHAPPQRALLPATAWAAHIGNQVHKRRAAPVEGPRFLVPAGQKALEEALVAPVVLRRSTRSGQETLTSALSQGERGLAAASEPVDEGQWLPDSFACARCGAPHEPMPQTCGGPLIPRLCATCRTERRAQLPDLRLMICEGGCCTREGARAVASAARQTLAMRGLAARVDVMPVTCLGECSVGPFLRVSTTRGEEPAAARGFRERTVERARQFASDEGEVLDEESELVLSRFAALVQPREVERLVDELAKSL